MTNRDEQTKQDPRTINNGDYAMIPDVKTGVLQMHLCFVYDTRREG